MSLEHKASNDGWTEQHLRVWAVVAAQQTVQICPLWCFGDRNECEKGLEGASMAF